MGSVEHGSNSAEAEAVQLGDIPVGCSGVVPYGEKTPAMCEKEA